MSRRAWGVIYEHQRQYNKAEYEYLSALLETKEIKHPYYSLCYLFSLASQLPAQINFSVSQLRKSWMIFEVFYHFNFVTKTWIYAKINVIHQSSN